MKKLIPIFLLIFLFSIVYAQSKNIEIRDFKGVFTNSDLEDIPKENTTVLKNLRARNGKLVKTFAFGGKIDSTLADTIENITTYLNNYLTVPKNKIYIATHIDSGTKILTVYAYDDTTWKDITSTFTDVDEFIAMTDTPFYHNVGYNPIIMADGILRILPGAVGEADGSHQSNGLWLGYIDREYFDGFYDPTPGFYGYSTEIKPPDLTFYKKLYNNGYFTSNKNYKFSYIYDGNQESFLSDGIIANVEFEKFLELDFTIINAEFNKRITAMNVYRSDDIDGIYEKVHTIDFLRDTNTVYSGTGARSLSYYLYLGGVNPTTTPGSTYSVHIGGVTYDATRQTASNLYKLIIPSIAVNTRWDSAYTIGSGSFSYQIHKSGGFIGRDAIYVDSSFIKYNLSGGILYWDTSYDSLTQKRIIIKNNYNVIGYKIEDDWSDSLGTSIVAKTWKVLNIIDGLYCVTDSTDSSLYSFYDTDLTIGDEHPFASEVSIKVNGKFAQIIGGRLWQVYIVLDPGNENEEHDNWVSYSELNQYDVNPVSNVISFGNIGMGEITGLSELFGNPVIIKSNVIILIDIKSDPGTPANWQVIESKYNIGNIADRGYISALGNLYLCYYDGIYRLSLNNLAPSSQTPIEHLKITEPISDVYEALTLQQKQDIRSQYDQSKSEIVFKLGEENWAYNVATKDWREIDSDKNITLMTLDEYANIMVYDSTNGKIYSFGADDTVGIDYKTKTFHISDERKESVRYAWITYKSATDLKLCVYSIANAKSGIISSVENGLETNVDFYTDSVAHGMTYHNYVEITNTDYQGYNNIFQVTAVLDFGLLAGVGFSVTNNFVATSTGNWAYIDTVLTLPANSVITTRKVSIGRRMQKFAIRLVDRANSSTATEIYRIRLEYEGDY